MNLKTTYLGIDLKNPIVASVSTLSNEVDNVKKMEDNGVSAVVLYSLFEEQITQEKLITRSLFNNNGRKLRRGD